MTILIARGFKICDNFHRTWFDDFGMYLVLNELRVGRGSEGGHLFWICHGGGTVSRYFVKYGPGAVSAVTDSSRIGKLENNCFAK